MTPAIPLFDPQLERLFVLALIQNPERHDQVTLGMQDLGDFKARAVYQAFANVLAANLPPTTENLRAQLLTDAERWQPSDRPGDHVMLDRAFDWLDDYLAIPCISDPPWQGWELQILDLADGRRAAIDDAEPAQPAPRKTPRGPRADNLEPVRLGEAFRRFLYERDGEATLVRWARAWWRYTGVRYVELDDELLDRDLISFLDVVVAPQQVKDKKTGLERSEVRRVTSRNRTLSEVRKSLTFVMPAISGGAPQWTSPEEGDPESADCVVCENGILNLRTMELRPSTPRLFATTAIGARWDPDAPPPTQWFEFLQSLWGDDKDSILALQQLFGYLLTPDTSQQKIFALIGPPRCGKGTVARVLRALLGHDAVCNPTLQSLERPFGLAPLVGKTAAIIGDARLGGQSDQQQVVERLLSISGEDALSIDRKNRDPVNVQLSVRVVLLSNELPKLYDTSGALASRFVILKLSKSFLGNEDTQLTQKLLQELPGILRWAIEGREDLAERGRFVSPAASEEAAATLRSISNPLGVFLEECTELDASAEVLVDDLYKRYSGWCEGNGRDPANKQIFGRDLRTIHPEIRPRQRRRADGQRERLYDGIRCL